MVPERLERPIEGGTPRPCTRTQAKAAASAGPAAGPTTDLLQDSPLAGLARDASATGMDYAHGSREFPTIHRGAATGRGQSVAFREVQLRPTKPELVEGPTVMKPRGGLPSWLRCASSRA